MQQDQEQKLFSSVLWIFLIGALAFFLLRLSSGAMSLPAPIWYMLLFLDAGAVIFIFVPHAGRGVPGVPGRHEEAVEKHRWYPQSISEFVDGRSEKVGAGEGMLPPSRAIPPVPLVPLLLLLVVIVLAYPRAPREGRWRAEETARLRTVYAKAQDELLGLVGLVSNTGTREAAAIDWGSIDTLTATRRAAFIQSVDSAAASVRLRGAPFPELGIQIMSKDGERVAWGGSPHYLGTERPGEPGVRVFTARTPLYALLVSQVTVAGGGSVLVDLPLEVNYRINNRFLRSTSLGELLSKKYGEEVEFSFSVGERASPTGSNDRRLANAEMRVAVSPNAGVQVTGIVLSSPGTPLARLKVLGESFTTFLKEGEKRRSLWGSLVLSAAAVVIAVWVYRTYCKREARGRGRLRVLVRRLLVLGSFVVILRLILIRLDIPGGLAGTALFDPLVFADNLRGGFLVTAGDFLISSIFALILVFGSIKAYRTYYRGTLERGLVAGGPFRPERFVVKAAVVFGSLAGALWLCEHLVSRVVLLSIPRLMGLDMNFFDLSVLALHCSLLFMISAFFILALFISRLALVSGGARLFEGLAALGLALGGIAFLDRGHWPLVCLAAALVVLSFRIFPLLRKEETISIVFASFFLVLVCSLGVYAVMSERYTDRWKGYVREKTVDFDKPEDNWMQLELPDICANIAAEPATGARILSKSESAAFEIWAESRLSRLPLSCVVEVYDAAGALLSRFAVGMPFELPRAAPDLARFHEGPFTESSRVETRGGAVLYYTGYAPIVRAGNALVGWVEITIPYFFENPELLARTGRMAPEILQNIDRGTAGRRSDAPEKLLVARVSGNRVAASSNPALRTGSAVPARSDAWFELRVGREKYECMARLGGAGEGYLVGFRVAGVLESLLQWATVVSVDVILTLVSLVILFVLKRLPVLKGVMPDVSPSRGLGFRQKVLLSFLLVSILPVVILGIFSSQVIAGRFRAEGENQALLGVQAAASLIDHSIRTEAESLAGGRYIAELLAGERKTGIPSDGGVDLRSFTLIGSDGEVLYGSAAAGLSKAGLGELLTAANVGRVVVSYEAPKLYGGIVLPIVARGIRGGYLYYRRPLDDEFVKSVAVALATDINIYYDALIRASSERELFVGGFLDPICAPPVFVDVALEGSPADVERETLGEYSYYVASAPLPALGGAESAVLSVPMLYQPILMRAEVQRTSTLILGLLALLFASTVTLGVFLAGKIFNPIEALRGGTRKIIEGELEFRLDAQAPDEIGELVESFNAMTAALREARRDLLERQRYLAAVLDNIATGVMATDREGKIITLNPAGEKLLRLSGAGVIGRRPEQVFGEGLEPMRALFSGSGEDVREVELSLFSGEMGRTVKAVVASLVEGGERLGTVVVFDDLTELIRSKKLAAWVEMARQIAHEVKNPLTPIKLSAQLMKKAYESGSGDFAPIFKSGVETVIQQTEILRRIASEFSNFGKTVQLNPEVVPLEDFLGGVVSAYRGAERFDVKLSCEGGVKARADKEALRKIIVNLMENAIEASPDGGEIIVNCGADGDRVRISVIDSGKGLPPEMQERLFEPYFSTKTNGIGLGLAISQSLARSMDGEIRLRNREGRRGVEATVVLPLAKEG